MVNTEIRGLAVEELARISRDPGPLLLLRTRKHRSEAVQTMGLGGVVGSRAQRPLELPTECVRLGDAVVGSSGL